MHDVRSHPVAGPPRAWCDAQLAVRIARARDRAADALWRERGAGPAWTGELSASALSTATAVTALTLVARADPAVAARVRPVVDRGFAWLVARQNSDGGWGDTTRSISNISTTALGWAALALCAQHQPGVVAACVAAEHWLGAAAGSLEPAVLVEAIEERYESDRTFSIPILTMAALCGRLGPEREAWARVRQLPFEVAALPQRWFGALRLPVVSYALPALIAIGQARHGRRPTLNPVLRWLRDRSRARTLDTLARLQPENGGFLEATPLTSFVTMSLAAIGLSDHPVARRGVAFLEASARPDGSWPIDTNLATWLTTLSINALAPARDDGWIAPPEATALRDWLLRQQYRREHPYTLAAPGGWAWTDLPGGVPDADDTAGAILALLRLGAEREDVRAAVAAAVTWLLDLQNANGGVPTFCRGWGRLGFDRSSPDITAHAVRAWSAARGIVPPDLQRRIDDARRYALRFLRRKQRSNGAWVPLWFGHQQDPAEENPVYGTSRVVTALAGLEGTPTRATRRALTRGVQWLIARQNADAGWSGAPRAVSSLEETALAVEALAAAFPRAAATGVDLIAWDAALARGAGWLCAAIERDAWRHPVPIGFYFAKLWYFERLYPLVFATGALTRVAGLR